MLFQFSVSIIIIFLIELTFGILGFAYKDLFRFKFTEFINKTIKDYRTDPDLQDLIDFTQSYVSNKIVTRIQFAELIAQIIFALLLLWIVFS